MIHLDMRQNWYEGFAPGYPSTNKGLEATNRWIKSQGTLGNRLPIADMINFLLKQSYTWSFERNFSNPNCNYSQKNPSSHFKLKHLHFSGLKVAQTPNIRLRLMEVAFSTI